MVELSSVERPRGPKGLKLFHLRQSLSLKTKSSLLLAALTFLCTHQALQIRSWARLYPLGCLKDGIEMFYFAIFLKVS